MLIEQTLDGLRQLKLLGMVQALEYQRINTAIHSLAFEDRVAMLVDAERLARDNRRLKRLTRNAHMKIGACVEDIDYRSSRGLEKRQIASLANCDWIDHGQHLILTGPTGVGKTWLACALGHQAIRRGLPVIYYRFSRLLEEFEIARGDGSLPKLRAQLSKAKLLILDDWGISTLTNRNRQDLMELVDDRTGGGSLAITSQLPIAQWHDYLGDPTLADAILDRMVHSAHRIELQGESLRKTRATRAKVAEASQAPN